MKGEVRNPWVMWAISVFGCGIGPFFFWYKVGEDLKNYLGKDDLNPMMDVGICFLCFLYAFYLPIKYGALIQEAQQRAGIADAEDQGVMFLVWMFLCGLGYKNIQEELNKVWESGGGAPATF